MDTNLMIVWLFGIAVGGIVIFLVAQKVVIKRGSDGFSVEFERKVNEKIESIKLQNEKEKFQIESEVKKLEIELDKIKKEFVNNGNRNKIDNNQPGGNSTFKNNGDDNDIVNNQG